LVYAAFVFYGGRKGLGCPGAKAGKAQRRRRSLTSGYSRRLRRYSLDEHRRPLLGRGRQPDECGGRMSVKLLLLSVGLLGVGFSPASPAWSVECVVYGSLDKEFEASAVVFEARVVAVEWIPGRECCHVLSGWATLQTDRWWKGEPVRMIRLGAAGQIFKVGEHYVVFGFGAPPTADGCNNTKPIKESERTLEWLALKPSRRAG
jgi:hypothetical protein